MGRGQVGDAPRVDVEVHGWHRLADHSFSRTGPDVRTASVTVDGDGTRTLSGVRDLVLLSSTGSEFKGFAVDRFTTLAEANARQQGVAEQVRFVEQDLFETDLAPATVVTMYLLPDVVNRLKDKLVRELAMARFNRYWAGRVPELRPTAGYVQDARRWLGDVRGVLTPAERELVVRKA